MKHIFAAQTPEEFSSYEAFVKAIKPRLEAYIAFLEAVYAVKELPKAVLWTGAETAMQYISQIPVPAYTNEVRTVITPDLGAWQNIYLAQLNGLTGDTADTIRDYYKCALNKNHILQILGHELAHHSALFLDGFDDDRDNGIWFEEGMAEYISRRYFLTEEEFEAEVHINRQLVDLLNPRYGKHPLDAFGAATYEQDYASIFFEYWRSFLAVKKIVDTHQGDVLAVFDSYHKWGREHSEIPLTQWFGV